MKEKKQVKKLLKKLKAGEESGFINKTKEDILKEIKERKNMDKNKKKIVTGITIAEQERRAKKIFDEVVIPQIEKYERVKRMEEIENKIIELLNSSCSELTKDEFNRLAESIISYIDEIGRKVKFR